MIKIKKFQLNYNEDEVPMVYNNLAVRDYNKSFVLGIFEDKQLIFMCRLYYLNTKIRKELKLSDKIKYELADVYLYESYRGKNYVSNTSKIIYSKLCLDLVDNYLKEDKIYSLILWTTNDNIRAITRYIELGFSLVKNKIINNYYKNITSKLKYIDNNDVVVFIRNP